MPRFLITYDITCPRRLRRLHKGLKRLAMPVQYSVFLAELSSAGFANVVELIEGIIDKRHDDVRIYPLSRAGWQRRLGKPVLPAGITLTALPGQFAIEVAGESISHPAIAAPLRKQVPRRTTALQSRAAKAIKGKLQTGQKRGIQIL